MTAAEQRVDKILQIHNSKYLCTSISGHHPMSQVTLTILPFDNLSQRKELGIYCRSFTIDLVTELSRFRQFSIISLPLSGLAADFNESKSFEDLHFDYFIQGSFRCDQELVRINVQLYNSHSRAMIWGNRLEGQLPALAEIQDNLLAGVVGVLQQQINADLLSQIRKRPTVEFKAYEHWLYGMEEIRQGSAESDLIAREHFQHALAIQPDYSLAYTGMSLTYFNEWSCQLWDIWELCKNGAFDWAHKAIELDDQNYIAAMVLGKIFMFEGSHDTAEYYFRKSLRLNANDPDILIQIAVCFIYLGLEKESLELHRRAMQLHPFNAELYAPYAIFIHFELGEFEKAAALLRKNPVARIANADAYYAAIYYYLGQPEKMQTHWDIFLDRYRRLISKGKDFTIASAIEWMMKINPYREKTRLEEFLRFISNDQLPAIPAQKAAPALHNGHQYFFRKDDAAWQLAYEGAEVRVPDLKGLHDIRKLLAEPHQLFHCAELMGSRVEGKGEKLIDEKARKKYQQTILELQADMHMAEQHSDFSRAEKLQQEYDLLIDHLSQTLNLKGEARQAGSTVEKARSAITWRIRNAIARIEQFHPPLGAHLANAIKTGTLCAYQPDRSLSWVTS